MLHLAFIFHMHQPYYKNLLTNEAEVPWVRLHGVKDYLDMLLILNNYPKIHQTFNLVPSLLEQIEDLINKNVKDRFLELSCKPAQQLTTEDKQFLLERFFSINPDKAIAVCPRYYELYFKKEAKREFSEQDYLDLQVWFNLDWIDPSFRESFPELKVIVAKARFFSEDDKRAVLEAQSRILADIIPAYKRFIASGQVEVTTNPFYHPILPLLCNIKIGKEANVKTALPQTRFAYPEDAQAQINEAVKYHKERFGVMPQGMWPSEEGVSEHILPLIINSGIKWIVTDEGMLFKSLKLKKRESALLYQPHLLKRKEGELSIIFRDRNISDLIGFIYHRWDVKAAVDDFIKHLENISKTFKDKDILVPVAMDGENAWEFYSNDGHDFLELLYKRISASDFIKTVTVSEYLKDHPAVHNIPHLAAGSWIYSEFGKWIGSPQKNKAWEYLSKARQRWQEILDGPKQEFVRDKLNLIWKQMYICEGSDWFWWYGDNNADFDRLFRMHLSNFYTLIEEVIPDYLKKPL